MVLSQACSLKKRVGACSRHRASAEPNTTGRADGADEVPAELSEERHVPDPPTLPHHQAPVQPDLNAASSVLHLPSAAQAATSVGPRTAAIAAAEERWEERAERARSLIFGLEGGGRGRCARWCIGVDASSETHQALISSNEHFLREISELKAQHALEVASFRKNSTSSLRSSCASAPATEPAGVARRYHRQRQRQDHRRGFKAEYRGKSSGQWRCVVIRAS